MPSALNSVHTSSKPTRKPYHLRLKAEYQIFVIFFVLDYHSSKWFLKFFFVDCIPFATVLDFGWHFPWVPFFKKNLKNIAPIFEAILFVRPISPCVYKALTENQIISISTRML